MAAVIALIRSESPADLAAIRLVNERAFGGVVEANAIEKLRERGQVTISLVAEVEGRVVGHILFSPVTLVSAEGTLTGLGLAPHGGEREPRSGSPSQTSFALAPLAVRPEFQRRGLGSQLTRAGLVECRRRQCGFVVVLGHSDYYPRFGFERASLYGLRCEWAVPDPAFMVIELHPGALVNCAGLVKYQPEWSSV